MPLPRRHLLALIGVVSLGGCSPDPTIHGDPERALVPPEPTQAPAVAELAAALTRVQQSIGNEPDPWRGAASAQVGAWLERLRLADPLGEGEPAFPAPSAAASEELSPALAAATDAARRAVDAATGQAARLFQLSILAGVTGLSNPALAPVADDAAPARFADVANGEALTATLTRVLALQQGLERGLGLLGRDDPLKAQAAQRRGEVRFLRNRITAAIGADRPLQDAHYELPAFDATTFSTAWAGLELTVLHGLLGLAATDGGWVDVAVEQVAKAQAIGGQLPTWPGWVRSA
ncbi:MAG: hypothetical protein Q4D96_06420 [Propionibacteriaceae bacterium]|nr:hypothetical protein [Propionibacteriaceae bacterium]MDO5066896.1 hypothetical protein [Propionibacteriaceae bacterium]